MFLVLNGPQRSMWTRSKHWLALFSLLGKSCLWCLAKTHTSQKKSWEWSQEHRLRCFSFETEMWPSLWIDSKGGLEAFLGS